MSSTTSKRLRRVWGIVDGAAETGAHSVSIDYLQAALEGGEKWARLEALAAEAPLPPEEYATVWAEEWRTNPDPAVREMRTPDEYERWYDQELDRIERAEEAILSEPNQKEKQ